MSQIFADTGSTPSADIETLTGDQGLAVGPDGAHNINILAITSEDFNALELQTVGVPASNTITVTQFNTILGSATGTGVTTLTLITFDLGLTDAVYVMDITLAVFDFTNDIGAGCNIFGTIRTIGGVATIIDTPDKVDNGEGSLVFPGADCNMIASGNNFLLQYLVPVGVTVRVSAFVHYTKQE